MATGEANDPLVATRRLPDGQLGYGVAFSADGRRFARGTGDGYGILEVGDLTTGATLTRVAGERWQRIGLSPDGAYAAGDAGSPPGNPRTGRFTVVRIADGRPVPLDRGTNPGAIESYAFSPDGTRLFVRAAATQAFDLPTGKLLWTADQPWNPWVVSADGRRLVGSRRDGTGVAVYDGTTGRALDVSLGTGCGGRRWRRTAVASP